MEFNPNFHGQFQFPYLSTFFQQNPTSPQPNNPLVQPNNTTFVTNMPNHSESSGFTPIFASPLELMEGVVLPLSGSMITNPFYGVSTPSLGQHCFLHQAIPSNEQFIKDFIEPANVNFTPENINAFSHDVKSSNNKIVSAKFVLDFTEKATFIPTQFVGTAASSSHPPTPPPPISDGGSRSMLKLKINDNLVRQIEKKIQRANGSGKMSRQSKREKTQNDGKSSNNITKGQWTPDEDRVLKELVGKHGEKNWSKIATLFENRIGKQCRERWYNHLQPNIKKGPWTLEEDIMLIKAHKELGNKWAKIAKRIPGRSENTIKNRWNVTKRSKNIKVHNNTTDEYDDSVLQTYIKDVTTSITGQKDKKASTLKKKKEQKEEEKKIESPISKAKGKAPMFSGLCDTDLGLTLRMEFPTRDFCKEECVVPLFRNAPM